MRQQPAAKKVAALVLAGDRPGDADAVAKATGASCKALAPVLGTPMLLRVIEALQTCERIGSCVLVGPSRQALESCPPLRQFTAQPQVNWLPGADSLSGSAQAGLADLDPEAPVLITTADHALLTAPMLEHFLEQALASRADLSLGLVKHDLLKAAYPETQRTVLRFSDGSYCGCNLYLIANARGRGLIPLWRRAESDRKSPRLMVAKLLGWGAVARYVSGSLSLAQASQAIFDSAGASLGFVAMPFPQAGIDVDTPADLALAEKILASS